VVLENLGRPNRETATEEVAVTRPDATVEREGKGDGWNVLRIAGNSPARLFETIQIRRDRGDRQAFVDDAALSRELHGLCGFQIPAFHE
jgi:hypothetical protein